MLIRFVFQFLTNVLLTVIMEPVFHASRDTILRTELASSLHSTTLSPLIQDAPPGIGTIKSVSHAPRTGSSTEKRNVYQLLTNALLMPITEPVFHASRDTTLRMEPVSSPHSTTLNPLIPDVPLGIGIIKFVFHAPNNGPSMLIKSAFQFLTNALLMPITELAFHASRDTTLRTEPVSSPHSTTLSPLIQDAPLGIGTIKSAFPAPNTGFSMEIRNAFQFLTNALLMPITELVFHASRVTTLRTELVSHLISTMLILPTSAVLPGIGTTKSAFPAQRDGSSTQRRDVCPSMTTVTVTMRMEPALHASSDTP
jgi:hypothetical protein